MGKKTGVIAREQRNSYEHNDDRLTDDDAEKKRPTSLADIQLQSAQKNVR
jgi:hypothetical protein